MAEPKIRTVLHGEELEAAIAEMIEHTDKQAAVIKRENQKRGRVHKTRRTLPDIRPALTERLRSALEDEVVPAVEAPDNRLRQLEVDHEVIKKALVGLRLSALKSIARDARLELGGNIEEVATRIAEHFRWDENETARLVLAHEEEPSTERGHQERLFPLESPPDLDYVARRFEYVLGRYIRIGIAKWFVFERIDVAEDLVRLWGTVRSYLATVTEEDAAPTLHAIPRDDRSVFVDLWADSDLVRVHQAGASDARAAMTALSIAAKVAPLGYVPLRPANDLSGPAGTFAPASLFMLDLLNKRLRSSGFFGLNLRVVRFKVGDLTEGDEETGPRPNLRAVRFDGDHLLDSPVACKLLADEGRALVDISFEVRTHVSDVEVARFPARIGLDTDHIAILTGFGTTAPEASLGVHRSILEAVSDELKLGVADPQGLSELGGKVKEVAGHATATDRPELLFDAEADE